MPHNANDLFLLFQLMASGVNGGPGESVRGHVVQGYKLGHELVPIRGQLMEENNVPDQVERHAPVTLVVVQVRPLLKP